MQGLHQMMPAAFCIDTLAPDCLMVLDEVLAATGYNTAGATADAF